MPTYGSVRWVAVGLGLSYTAAIVLFGDLLGSSADGTQAFTDYFDDERHRAGDIVGGVLLVGASLFMVAAGLTLRHHLGGLGDSLRRDLLLALAMLTAAGVLVSAGLLTAPSAVRALGAMTGDPGMEPAGAAAVAQAGTIVLVGALLPFALWTVLVAEAAAGAGAIGRWLRFASWLVAVLALLGITVAAAFPIGLWWAAFGFGWTGPEQTDTAPA